MIAVEKYYQQLVQDTYSGGLHAVVKGCLTLCSHGYHAGLSCRGLAYGTGLFRKRQLPVPVISVGNLTWGGTGKTPLVEWIAEQLLTQGQRPLLLTRGYGRDETEQIKAHLPQVLVGVGKNRFHVAQALLRHAHADVALLDDGFQHWALDRALDIVTINALNPFGNGHLIPRGMLREPRRALQRADMIVVSHANAVTARAFNDLEALLQQLAPHAMLVHAVHEPRQLYRASTREPVEPWTLTQKPVVAFSGIGSPESFAHVLGEIGVRPVEHVVFPDHHRFSQAELAELRARMLAHDDGLLVTTEKDFYRAPQLIARLADPVVLSVGVRIIHGEERFRDRLRRLSHS